MYSLHVKQNKYKGPSFPVHSSVLKNQKGNAVLAVLSTVIVVGVFLQTTGFGRITESNSILSSSRVKSSRDSIAYQLERYATLPTAFRNSLASNDNSDLQNCLLGTGTSLCKGDGTEYPISLYAPTPSGTAPQLLAGPGPVSNAHPVLYDTKGNLCQTGATSASLACPFEVYTTFTAKCLVAGASCATAESISVHYLIRTPETLFSNAGIKDKITLATVDKFALDIQRSAILPPAYGYVPNALNGASLISETGKTTLSQARAAVQKVVGPNNPALVQKITDTLYNYYKYTDLSVISALTAFWLQNPSAADGAADDLTWYMRHNYTVDVAKVNAIAAATSWIVDPALAWAMGEAEITDGALAHAITNALVGITDKYSMAVVANARITNPVMSQTVSTVLISSGINGGAMWALASGAKTAGITDVPTLQTYASVIVAANAMDWNTAYDIITKGITDVAVATQMEANYQAAAANAIALTPTPTPAPTGSDVVMTTACTSSTSCGTTVGM